MRWHHSFLATVGHRLQQLGWSPTG